MQSLSDLHQRTVQKLHEMGEHLWLYSNPPYISSESEIPVARFDGEQAFKHHYRLKLQRRYGKKLMLYSGIHFNFSFQEDVLQKIPDRNAFYLKLYKYLSSYSWLLVMLTAASPLYDQSLDADGQKGIVRSPFASMRNSIRGYWNQFIPELNYTDLQSYADSIQNYINKGILFSASELYLPIRMKPPGENSLENLVNHGIDHIELRMFDLNPFEPLGIAEQDLVFAYLLILWLSSLPDFDFHADLQIEAVKHHQATACYDLSQITIQHQPAKQAAVSVLDQMTDYFSDDPEKRNIIHLQKLKLIGA